VPGDPVDSILGEQAAQEDRDALRTCLRLDRSLPSQYVAFVGDVVDTSLGMPCDGRTEPVRTQVVRAFVPTLQLGLSAVGLAMLFALPLGAAAALRPRSWIDFTALGVALFGMSIPNFWLGPMLLIVFSIFLAWLPTPGGGVTGLAALALPALTLALGLSARLVRMTRAALLEVLGQDYVRTARAKGASELRVVVRHAFRNAGIPVVSVIGMQLGAMLAGTIVVEKVFARPGLGSLLLDSIARRDYMHVQGAVIAIAAAYVVVNVLTDIAYAAVDPRVDATGRAG
jgi:peptide/nickel transport system permease protein